MLLLLACNGLEVSEIQSLASITTRLACLLEMSVEECNKVEMGTSPGCKVIYNPFELPAPLAYHAHHWLVGIEKDP